METSVIRMSDEENRNILRKFGFEIDFGKGKEFYDDLEVCVYTKQEIMDIMGFTGTLSELRFRLFMRRKFFVSYWKVYRLEEIGPDEYIWNYYDSLDGYY